MKIKELLTDESKWTKGYAARDVNNEPCLAGGQYDVCWCLIGAAYKCYSQHAEERKNVIEKMNAWVRTKFGSTSIDAIDFNDNPQTTFSDIRKLVEELDI